LAHYTTPLIKLYGERLAFWFLESAGEIVANTIVDRQ